MFDNTTREILVHNEYYALSDINDTDHEAYAELKRQVNGNDTLFLNPFVADIVWNGILHQKGIYTILTEEMAFCGVIEVKDNTRTPEIGLELLSEYRNKGIARNAMELLTKLIYEPDQMDYYTLRIKKDNTHSRHVFKKMGASCLGDDLSTLEQFQDYLSGKDHFSKKEDYDTLTEFFKKVDGDAAVVKYKLDPKCLM